MISYWEKKAYFDNPDFVIVGSGIVGVSAAFHLRQKYPTEKILIIDNAPFSNAASFKNAGFACFGSAGEILSDYTAMGKELTLATVQMRLKGLESLFHWIDKDSIDYQPCGSWELFGEEEENGFLEIAEQLDRINSDVFEITNRRNTYKLDPACAKKFGFHGLPYAIQNEMEGSIDTAKLNLKFQTELILSNIQLVKNCDLLDYEDFGEKIDIQTSIASFSCKKLLFATNGFSKDLFPELDVQPARAQVLVTKPIDQLKVNGTFHMHNGYDYFRNIDNRVLIGGGRNLSLEGENTSVFSTTDQIQDHLEKLLRNKLLPSLSFEIDQRWSGIMGVGQAKKPLIGKKSQNVSYGIRLGGMGIAIGTEVGRQLAKLQ